jgi:hypothetical protein
MVQLLRPGCHYNGDQVSSLDTLDVSGLRLSATASWAMANFVQVVCTLGNPSFVPNINTTGQFFPNAI